LLPSSVKRSPQPGMFWSAIAQTLLATYPP
jgi:hypothetical protein